MDRLRFIEMKRSIHLRLFKRPHAQQQCAAYDILHAAIRLMAQDDRANRIAEQTAGYAQRHGLYG